MPRLEYASTAESEESFTKSVAVLSPTGVAIAVLVACHWLPNDIADPLCIVAFSLAEVATIIMLLIWRRRLMPFALIAGWVVAGLGALYLSVLAADIVGIVRTP